MASIESVNRYWRKGREKGWTGWCRGKRGQSGGPGHVDIGRKRGKEMWVGTTHVNQGSTLVVFVLEHYTRRPTTEPISGTIVGPRQRCLSHFSPSSKTIFFSTWDRCLCHFSLYPLALQTGKKTLWDCFQCNLNIFFSLKEINVCS